LEGEEYCRFDPDAEHIRRLESGALSALRARLAGPSKIRDIFLQKSGREVLFHVAECLSEPRQGSPPCSQRQHVPAFEPDDSIRYEGRNDKTLPAQFTNCPDSNYFLRRK
jgi:hypothetical protein